MVARATSAAPAYLRARGAQVDIEGRKSIMTIDCVITALRYLCNMTTGTPCCIWLSRYSLGCFLGVELGVIPSLRTVVDTPKLTAETAKPCPRANICK